MKKRPLVFGVVLIVLIVLLWIWNRFVAGPPATPPIVTLEEKDAIETMQYRYTSYSKQAFDGAAGQKKRIYFFSVPTCATCKTAHMELLNNPNSIPKDIVIFITNLEGEKGVAAKYKVSTPHTFVQVDEDNAVVATWTGGGIQELKEHMK